MLLVGDVWTMHRGRRAGAVYVDGERVLDVGEAEALRARYPRARVVRVERVTPGVADAHVHPLYWGQALAELDLTGLKDPRAVAERVAQRARALPAGTWIRGRGYLFDAYPTENLLDRAAPAHPVCLLSRDHHAAWVNTRALEASGITAQTPDPPGGRVLRDARGRPTGYLLERAVALVLAHLPEPGPEELERGLWDLARRGYTAAHAMAYEPARVLEWAEALAARGALPLRLWWALPRGEWRAIRPGWRGEDLEVAAVKFFADGALGSRTAWMHAPYPDGSTGMPLDSLEQIREEGRAALEAGFTLAVHAIGTRAVEGVLEVFHALAPLAHRPLRLEHVQHVWDAALPRFAGLPAVLSLQPVHAHADLELVRRHTPGREREAFRLRSLWRTGLAMAFGSDAPVAPPDLGAGLEAAVGEVLPVAERLTEAEAVYAFTRGAALAAGWLEYGVIAPGARADLGVWENGRLVARVWRGRLEPVLA